ncbi:MAG TPA: HPF/RaiA family ribosome-associated protein, partial [Gammaproteobacteria bacterium]|nr:HPF/RaiA family ribosome-associated protein [Gammaproteobacteria bacterium]
MQLPLEVTFRGMDHSDAMEAKIRERAEKLERYVERIMGCRVVVEAPHKHHHKGKIYHVSLDVTVPGNELVVNRDPKD